MAAFSWNERLMLPFPPLNHARDACHTRTDGRLRASPALASSLLLPFPLLILISPSPALLLLLLGTDTHACMHAAHTCLPSCSSLSLYVAADACTQTPLGQKRCSLIRKRVRVRERLRRIRDERRGRQDRQATGEDSGEKVCDHASESSSSTQSRQHR